MPTSSNASLLAVSAAFLTASCATRPALDAGGEAKLIRDTERARVAALVAGDLDVAAALHADDFQLVNPAGGILEKSEYLGAIASGQLDYLIWEPGEMAVRQAGRQAVIRYRSEIQVTLQGRTGSRTPHWHIDFYEKRNGKWQVVWSQATEVKMSMSGN